jgi:IS30 family transposase
VIVGKDRRGSAVGTAVQRTTRCVLLLHLLRGATPTWPGRRCGRRSSPGPSAWPASSPGTRAVRWPTHAGFLIATGIPVHCYRPDKPWPRGSNENTNRLLRQCLPQGTDLPVRSAGI